MKNKKQKSNKRPKTIQYIVALPEHFLKRRVVLEDIASESELLAMHFVDNDKKIIHIVFENNTYHYAPESFESFGAIVLNTFKE